MKGVGEEFSYLIWLWKSVEKSETPPSKNEGALAGEATRTLARQIFEMDKRATKGASRPASDTSVPIYQRFNGLVLFFA